LTQIWVKTTVFF